MMAKIKITQIGSPIRRTDDQRAYARANASGGRSLSMNRASASVSSRLVVRIGPGM